MLKAGGVHVGIREEFRGCSVITSLGEASTASEVASAKVNTDVYVWIYCPSARAFPGRLRAVHPRV